MKDSKREYIKEIICFRQRIAFAFSSKIDQSVSRKKEKQEYCFSILNVQPLHHDTAILIARHCRIGLLVGIPLCGGRGGRGISDPGKRGWEK